MPGQDDSVASQRIGEFREDYIGRTLLPGGSAGKDSTSRQNSESTVASDGPSERNLPDRSRSPVDEKYLKRVALRNLTVILISTSCMLSLYGYDFGITAWNVLSIKTKGYEEISPLYDYLAYHSEILGLVVACVPIGGAIGGILGGVLGNSFGRKAEMRLVNILCLTGAVLEVSSGVHVWTSSWYVYVYSIGRVVYGVGLGLSLRCGPMYLRETVAASFKDAATVSVKLSMVVGIIVSYTVGAILDDTLYGYSGAILIAIVSLIFLEFVPESPLYLLLHEDKYSRTQILQAVRFTNPSAGKAQVRALEEEVLTETLSYTPGHPSYCGNGTTEPTSDGAGNETNGTTTETTARDANIPARNVRASDGYHALEERKECSLAQSVKNLPSLTKAPGMRAALVLTAGLMIFEQASGMIAILYYGGVFLADIDFIPVDWGLALLGGLQLVMAIVVMYTINPIGRKPLLLYGLAGLFLSTVCLTNGGLLGLTGQGRWWVLVGLYAFTAFYSISLGALVWVLISDVFPTCHRAQAISIVSTAHFTTSALMVVLLPVMQDVGGYAAMFFCFMVVAFFANIFAHRFMVETKGLSLVEVQRALSKKAGFYLRSNSQSTSV